LIILDVSLTKDRYFQFLWNSHPLTAAKCRCQFLQASFQTFSFCQGSQQFGICLRFTFVFLVFSEQHCSYQFEVRLRFALVQVKPSKRSRLLDLLLFIYKARWECFVRQHFPSTRPQLMLLIIKHPCFFPLVKLDVKLARHIRSTFFTQLESAIT
jgi:hypothetical protein